MNAVGNGLLTTEEVAELLGVKESTLIAWRHHGRVALPHVKLSRAVRYRREDVEAFVRAQTISTTSSPVQS